MSVQAIVWAINQKVGNTPSKLILLMLANRAGVENTCFPSISLICTETELSPRTVIRGLAFLERREFISRKRIQKTTGGRLNNLYALNMPGLSANLTPGLSAKSEGLSATVGTYKNNDLNPHIEPKKEAISNSGKARSKEIAKFGTPAFKAWENAPLSVRKQAILTRQGDYLVPTEFPPSAVLLKSKVA